MKTNEDIESKIAELKAVGSPSASIKARELEWVLGIEEEPDEQADMITDSLIASLAEAPKSLWESLPAFVTDHNLYTFSKQQDAVKQKQKQVGPTGFAFMTDEEVDREREQRLGKAFKWKDLLGVDVYKATAKTMWKKKDKAYGEAGFYTKIPDEAADINTAELIASLTKDGKHRPLLDIDFPAVVIPSTTPGHGHLYIDKEMSWKDYKKLLNLFADLGIIEHGYRGASLARGYSALRLPWVKKETEESKSTITMTF